MGLARDSAYTQPQEGIQSMGPEEASRVDRWMESRESHRQGTLTPPGPFGFPLRTIPPLPREGGVRVKEKQGEGLRVGSCRTLK